MTSHTIVQFSIVSQFSMSDLLPGEIAYQEAHSHENRGPIIIGICSTLLVLSTIAIVLRVIARRIRLAKLGADDYLIFLAEVGFVLDNRGLRTNRCTFVCRYFSLALQSRYFLVCFPASPGSLDCRGTSG